MRVAIFGANGGTGHRLTRQALAAGHEVVAVTRNPDDFPVRGDHLTVARADVRDRRSTADAVDGTDAVLSTLGVPFTRRPIDLYSEGIASILDAMSLHGVKRVAAVSSAAVEPTTHSEGGFLLNRVLQPLVTRTIGRTTYADMRRMEALLRDSDLDWTVIRPSGLFDAEEPGPYRLAEDRSEGVFTSRADLAATMLAQIESRDWVHRFVAVTTTEGTPTVLQMLRREALGSH